MEPHIVDHSGGLDVKLRLSIWERRKVILFEIGEGYSPPLTSFLVAHLFYRTV